MSEAEKKRIDETMLVAGVERMGLCVMSCVSRLGLGRNPKRGQIGFRCWWILTYLAALLATRVENEQLNYFEGVD